MFMSWLRIRPGAKPPDPVVEVRPFGFHAVAADPAVEYGTEFERVRDWFRKVLRRRRQRGKR